jgi:hypothetical protein
LGSTEALLPTPSEFGPQGAGSTFLTARESAAGESAAAERNDALVGYY